MQINNNYCRTLLLFLAHFTPDTPINTIIYRYIKKINGCNMSKYNISIYVYNILHRYLPKYIICILGWLYMHFFK